MNIKKDIRFRVYIAFTCICLFGLLIMAKAAMIQINEGKELRAIAADMHLHVDTLKGERGNIYTEDGHLLVCSIPQFDLRVDFSVIHPDTLSAHIDELSASLAGILGEGPPVYWKAKLMQGAADKKHWRYVNLQNNVAYDKYLAVKALNPFNKVRRGGLIAEQETKRINPYGLLAARTIGLYRENSQKIGLEATYDSLLRGQDGSRMLMKTTGNTYIPVEGSEVEARNGYDLVSTLDLNIQSGAEYALKSVLSQYECLNGCAIVMEVKTGKVRAMVNLGRQSDGSYAEDFNYVLQTSEPGSTFKINTLLSLFSDKYATCELPVNCEGGAYRFFNRVMHDSHHGLGTMTVREAYGQSSNVAMAKLAFERYGKEPGKYVDHLKKLHINERTGIDIAGERQPYIIEPGNKDWCATTLPWMATGYGIMISPLRTCMIYNAVANNGRMMKPYLISEIRDMGRTVTKIEPTVLEESIAPPEVITQLQACTREVVLSGTGKHIRSPYYGISGKTGTAQVNDVIGGRKYGYKDGVYQGSFVGYFPNDNPEYTICVLIRTKPHGGAIYGGVLAAPVFRMISDKIFSTGLGGSWKGPLDSIAVAGKRLVTGLQATVAQYQNLLKQLRLPLSEGEAGLPAASIAQVSTDSSRRISLKPHSILRGQVPDVTGLGLRDALYLLEQEGLHVQVSGSGSVSTQSLAPGSIAARGQTITLNMN